MPGTIEPVGPAHSFSGTTRARLASDAILTEVDRAVDAFVTFSGPASEAVCSARITATGGARGGEPVALELERASARGDTGIP